MGRHHEDSPIRGRLHGNLLWILIAVSVVAATIAVWQFSSLGGDDEQALPAGSEGGMATGAILSGEPTDEAAAELGPTAAAPSTEEPSATPTSPDPTTEAEPSEPATSEAPRSPDSTPTGPTCTATLEIDKEWSGHIEVDVVIANIGEAAISDWEVTLSFSDVAIYHYWGMEHHEGDRYRSDWNGAVGPGGSTGASFQAEVEDGFALPDTVPCQAFDE
ncbi:hypothetical protein GCM10027447_29640 [Glycomyces halotolerans]